MRLRQMAYATEKTYLYWIRFFIRQQRIQKPDEMNADKLTAFLTYLAVHRHVSPNTQNQAFNALLFLFRHVLQKPLENIQAIRAKERHHVPVVLSTSEVLQVLEHLSQPFRTMVEIAWGAGLRKVEILRLRVKDIDFERREITIRQGKVIWQKGLARWKCRTRWPASIPASRAVCAGSLSLPRHSAQRIRCRAKSGVTIFTRQHWKRPFDWRYTNPGLPSASPVIPFAIPSRRNFLSLATTSEQFRNYSGIAM